MSMTKEAAAQYLYENVQVPVFFNRLADWGFQPTNQAEAQVMLKTAAELMLLHESQLQAEQAAGQSFIQKAAAAVTGMLNEAVPQSNPLPQQILQTAKVASTNPEIVAAVLAAQAVV